MGFCKPPESPIAGTLTQGVPLRQVSRTVSGVLGVLYAHREGVTDEGGGAHMILANIS